MLRSQLSWVRSQHPPTQWNLRGGRWSSSVGSLSERDNRVQYLWRELCRSWTGEQYTAPGRGSCCTGTRTAAGTPAPADPAVLDKEVSIFRIRTSKNHFGSRPGYDHFFAKKEVPGCSLRVVHFVILNIRWQNLNLIVYYRTLSFFLSKINCFRYFNTKLLSNLFASLRYCKILK